MRPFVLLIAADESEATINAAFDPFGYTRHRGAPCYWAGSRLEDYAEGLPAGNGKRVYASRLHRFFQPDRYSPFFAQEFNAYCYCKNDPVNRVDPSGFWSWPRWLVQLIPRPGRTPSRTATAASRGMPEGAPTLDAMLPAIQLEKLPSSAPLPARGLLNLEEDSFWTEVEAFRNEGAKVKPLASFESLGLLETGKSYKFTYANNMHFNVLTPAGSESSHAVVAGEMLGAQVISAGYIRRTITGTWVLNNHSGHYRPHIKSLVWPAAHLYRLNVRRIRISPY